MKELIKILVWIFLIILVFILQTSHFLSLGKINPNLILLIILGSVVSGKKIPEFLVLVFMIILLSAVFLPYWSKEVLVLGSLGFLALFFKKKLTGNVFFDFLILIGLGTLGFYLTVNFRYLFANPPAIIAELIYNLTFGLITLFMVKSFYRDEKTRIKS
ncbi:MAG: hypothetical protein AAB404_01350 [Patescibacteria group bacterium]